MAGLVPLLSAFIFGQHIKIVFISSQKIAFAWLGGNGALDALRQIDYFGTFGVKIRHI